MTQIKKTQNLEIIARNGALIAQYKGQEIECGTAWWNYANNDGVAATTAGGGYQFGLNEAEAQAALGAGVMIGRFDGKTMQVIPGARHTITAAQARRRFA